MQVFNPPLVNAHTHAAMVAFRGTAEDIPLNDWLNKYIWPFEKEKVNPSFIYQQTKRAIKEMKANGGLKALGIKNIEGKTASEIKKKLSSSKTYNFLYKLNANELKFF